MGYRSEVGMTLAPGAAQLLTALAAHDAELKELIEDAEGLQHCPAKLLWNSIKWYDSYKEIAAIEAFMDDCDTEDLEEHYRFVRAGEEMDDNEVRGWGYDNVNLYRSVEF